MAGVERDELLAQFQAVTGSDAGEMFLQVRLVADALCLQVLIEITYCLAAPACWACTIIARRNPVSWKKH